MLSLALMVMSVVIGVALGVPDGGESGTRSLFIVWNAITQVFTFGLPPVIVARMYYRDEVRSFLRFDVSGRNWLLGLAGVVVLMLLMPLTDWLSVWNDGWHWSGMWEAVERELRRVGEMSQTMVELTLRECHPLLSLLCVALVPAICEELFFRAGVQNLLQRWFKNVHVAVWVTAALFSLAHGEVFAFLPRFLLGALLGYLYVYGRSLLVNVLAHFANNAIVVVIYALMSGDSTSFDPSAPLALSPLLTIACTLAAVALLVVVFGKTRNASSSNK